MRTDDNMIALLDRSADLHDTDVMKYGSMCVHFDLCPADGNTDPELIDYHIARDQFFSALNFYANDTGTADLPNNFYTTEPAYDCSISSLNNTSERNAWIGRILGIEIVPSTVVSVLGHLGLAIILTIMPSYVTSSTGKNGQEAVMVKLVEDDRDVVPVDESPGSRDSPASVSMLAKRTLRKSDDAPSTGSFPQEPLLEESASGTKDVPSAHEPSDRYQKKASKNETLKSTDVTDKKETNSHKEEPEPRATVIDTAKVDTPHAYDSAPSMPSTASPPRMASGALGKVGDDYRNKILSAISAAKFYPKKALLEKIQGETVVTFTVNKNGSLAHISVKKPSGYNVLDEAAVTIVKKASRHFPSIPNELMSDSLSYDVPIIFKNRS